MSRAPKPKIQFDDVRKIGLALPEVTEGRAYGSPALKLRGELLACIAIHRSAEPDTLAVRMAFEDREPLLATDPDVYYLTDHYIDYPVVLVRLSRVHYDALPGLLNMAWRFVNARKRSAPKTRKPKRS
jgi:hypothetical protein